MTVTEARQIQQQLAGKVRFSDGPDPRRVGLIAGLDASISIDGKEMIGSLVLFNWPELEIVETVNALAPMEFPYVPGYLSFRELPVLLKTLSKLPEHPDLAIIDGHGYAHPRRFGIASHFGVVTGIPSIGCAKRRLIGERILPGPRRGEMEICHDGDEIIGSVVRTRENVTPVWISPGHLVSHRTAVEWIMRTVTRFRLPDPIRAAHQAATRFRHQSTGVHPS